MPLDLDEPTREFYLRAIRRMKESGLPFLVGGAYALGRYTGIERHTKDLDLFVKPDDAPKALKLFADDGHFTDMTFPHWLGKVYDGDAFIDVIFCSGNGLQRVDDDYLARGVPDEVLGEPVGLCPPEEMIWTKAFIQERERFDGADVAHLLRACGATLDWDHLVARFGPHWRVLLGHLVLFGYIYPGERSRVPTRILDGLLERLTRERDDDPAADKLCQGTFLSREQYLVDLGPWGYTDARLAQRTLTPEQVAHWTAAIGNGK